MKTLKLKHFISSFKGLYMKKIFPLFVIFFIALNVNAAETLLPNASLNEKYLEIINEHYLYVFLSKYQLQ